MNSAENTMNKAPQAAPRTTNAWDHRPVLAEFIGTALLVTAILASGIAATALSPDDVGLRLLEMSVTTGLTLTVLILVLGPVSGAHFNPVVSLVLWATGRRDGSGLTTGQLATHLAAQVGGGILGAVLANSMFGLAPLQVASAQRATPEHLIAEVVATTFLIVVILGLVRTDRAPLVAPAVGAYVSAAFWFTSSTCFANPAVTLGRAFSDTMGGIAPSSLAGFVGAQLVGAAVGLLVAGVLFPSKPAAASRHGAEPMRRSSDSEAART